jgi:3-deoxy-D-manno-octulosonic-acid transferase
VDAADAERLAWLGAPAERIRVTGDARYDQVWARAAAVDRESALLAPLASSRPTVVAGSTWPDDEAIITRAWRAVRKRVPNARLIIAPHEPAARVLQSLERWSLQSDFVFARLGASWQGQADVVLVDRVGVLGDLYSLADVAYVGGGFHGAGLHSVLEPAAFGVPVLFGPRHHANRDAGLLIAGGGGFSVTSPEEMAQRMIEQLSDKGAHAEAANRARALVQSGLGAAAKSAALVEQLLAIS